MAPMLEVRALQAVGFEKPEQLVARLNSDFPGFGATLEQVLNLAVRDASEPLRESVSGAGEIRFLAFQHGNRAA